jgi:hypothetical protein
VEYFKINNTDFSNIVNELKIGKKANYNAQTNAAGNTVVDYINAKRSIEVSIIPLQEEDAAPLLAAVDAFNVSLSFRNPITQDIEEGVGCIIPETDIEYYTIRQGSVMLKAFTLTFTEL